MRKNLQISNFISCFAVSNNNNTNKKKDKKYKKN